MSEEQVREIMKSQMHTVFKDIIEDATDKAIKVFADRLKEKIFKPWYFLEQIKFIKEDIDDLVKEMTGSCENAVVMGFDCREIEVIGGGDNE